MQGKNAPVAITAAMECEISEIWSALDERSDFLLAGYPAASGFINGWPVVAARSRIGMINTAILTAALVSEFHPLCLLSQGTAGSHLEQLHPGDLILGAQVRCINSASMAVQDCQALEQLSRGEWEALRAFPGDLTLLAAARRTPCESGAVLEGIIGSGDFWTHGAADIRRIRSRFGTVCEEMETFAAAQVCSQTGTPFLGIRIISNNELTSEDFLPDAALSCQRYTLALVRTLINDLRAAAT